VHFGALFLALFFILLLATLPSIAIAADKQPIKYINGQPVLWTDPTIQVTA
jgi:hypothetical protein